MSTGSSVGLYSSIHSCPVSFWKGSAMISLTTIWPVPVAVSGTMQSDSMHLLIELAPPFLVTSKSASVRGSSLKLSNVYVSAPVIAANWSPSRASHSPGAMSSTRRSPVTRNSPQSLGQSGLVWIVCRSETRMRTPSIISAIAPSVATWAG